MKSKLESNYINLVNLPFGWFDDKASAPSAKLLSPTFENHAKKRNSIVDIIKKLSPS